MKNSQGVDCIIEFQSPVSRNEWSYLVKEKAKGIDQFLKKDKFQFGNFSSISADKL
jgi:hypothetical protein